VIFEKLAGGDGRFRVRFVCHGKRVQVTLGKLSEGITLGMARAALAELRTQADRPSIGPPLNKEPTS
jgi:hypothetical protein